MAVALAPVKNLTAIDGIRIATVSAGIKKNDTDDLVLISLTEGSQVATAFTQNAFCAAPVTIAKKHFAENQPRALIINAGNANAGTGKKGESAALQCCDAVADALNINSNQVLPFSTGVISEPLPVTRICKAIPRASQCLDKNGWLQAANGIMTTDTLAKGCSRTVMIDGIQINLTGIIKGAGMICPNMATMLAYIGTDAQLETGLLQTCLKQALTKSLNSLTVDGDTSTNDACMLIATGQAGNQPLGLTHPDWPAFIAALESLFIELGQAVIRDAEGATKFVTITVEGGLTTDECRQVAYTIAHSPLVKTALFASDANWGRILAAVGRSGLDNLDISLIDLYLGDICLLRGGEPDAQYKDAMGQAEMAKQDIILRIVLGRGAQKTTVWTSDLSHDYVTINAEYRT